MRRSVYLPLWSVLVLAMGAISGPPLSVYASVQIAKRNSERLIDAYQADRAAAAAQSRTVLCALFSSQLDAFENAESPTGKASYAAWLDVYKLTGCQPARD